MTAADKELAKSIITGMMEADLAILRKGMTSATPEVQQEMARLLNIAIKCVKGSR